MFLVMAEPTKEAKPQRVERLQPEKNLKGSNGS